MVWKVWPEEVSAVESAPYSAINFEVDLGAGAMGFAEVTGLGCDIDYDFDDARPREPQSITSRVHDVTLKRGLTGNLSVWEWVQNALNGKYEPRTVTITLLDTRREPACTWVLHDARPTKWVGPTLAANSDGVAMEELVLRAERLEFTARATAAPRDPRWPR